MSHDPKKLLQDPLILAAVASLILAILGFSGVFSALAGISKILFLVSLGFLGLVIFKRFYKK